MSLLKNHLRPNLEVLAYTALTKTPQFSHGVYFSFLLRVNKPSCVNHRSLDVFLWLGCINTVRRDFLCFSSLPFGHISWYSFRCSLCIKNIHNIIHIYVLIYLYLSTIYQGFPGSSIGKESSCRAGDLGLICGLGRSSGERNGNQV